MLDRNLRSMKFQESSSAWIRSFSLEPIKCLIVCRGPVRKEAIDIFRASGVREFGMLLSEKDSIVYPKALAPELRDFDFPGNVHRVPDYMGSGQEEKISRIHEIISIAKENGYTHIFAGYGFMAEDSDFITTIEKSGLRFMGPGSHVARRAGAKDEAKKLAEKLGVKVTPGINNISALALLRKAPGKEGLEKIAKEYGIDFTYNEGLEQDTILADEANAEALLQKSYLMHIELVTIPELQKEAEILTQERIWSKYPGKRVRYKYIGGGGGKGQRVISRKEEIASAVMEILAESKVVAPGSNRNFLIELNIENTRHNEIQVIGNGDWCITLGGRDCSVQMHEQKLLEISVTQEQLKEEIPTYKTQPSKAQVLSTDLKVLEAMERDAEVFCKAVNLDSVSTFECIVSGGDHFFMEVNTRIQVEHRVTEMAYMLKFTNPDNPDDFFYLDSLIEAMALLSLHGARLPKPDRIVRHLSGAEVRINATNRSLQPHAGGIIQSWSPPHPDEIRDDQGIGTRNPDTGAFVHYNLAGAYDSNVALVITFGKNRKDNLEKLANILRVTELRGQNLETNLLVHYGLISWILGKDPMFKPATSFMISYLAGIGSMETLIRDLDLEIIWDAIVSRNPPQAKQVLARKSTLLMRPIERILSNPHLLGGFLGLHQDHSWKREGGRLHFLRNPIQILDDLYQYLHLEDRPGAPASEKIWDHDEKILREARGFYQELEFRGIGKDWETLNTILTGNHPPHGIDSKLWEKIQSAHAGFQIGTEVLKILPRIGYMSRFLEISVDDKLEAVIPAEFLDSKTRDPLIKALTPPPRASSDEILAPMGGMFYSREAPNLPPLISEGDHFEAGQPLFIIEVMKMFNKVSVPFSGTVVKNLMKDSDGKIIAKGQTIFKIKPDETIQEESQEELERKRREASLRILED